MSDRFNPINEDARSASSQLSDPGEGCSSSQSDNNNQNDSAFPDEDEETITMVDIIEREDKLQDEAAALLGGADEKNCTFSKGYLHRQALYSCATCFESAKMPAALCLACSLECHDGHEVYELYTKRNFRCDCGNSRFASDFECKLTEKKKLPLNESNKYNHNFNGKYCTCDKRYPPDEDDTSVEAQDSMWQCVVCEDWYHTKHLNAETLPDTFEELICGTCVENLDFIRYYSNLAEIPQIKSTECDDVKKGECILKKLTQHQFGESTITKKEKEEGEEVGQKPVTNDVENEVENKSVCCDSKETSITKVKEDNNDYNSVDVKTNNNTTNAVKERATKKVPIFWLSCDWREKLCKCEDCIKMYKEKDCLYLIDQADSIQSYETIAREKNSQDDSSNSEHRLMTELGKMNRTAAIEAINGYNSLKENLSNYLRKFADDRKVVREQDIHEFFEQMRAKKRPKFE